MTHAKLRQAAEAQQSWALGIYKNREQAADAARFRSLANPAAIIALLDEIAERSDENSRWLLRMADIREASGIGAGPMLDEVPDALRAMRATITRLEAELSAARAALAAIACEAERKEGNWVHLKRVIALSARQAAITGGE